MALGPPGADAEAVRSKSRTDATELAARLSGVGPDCVALISPRIDVLKTPEKPDPAPVSVPARTFDRVKRLESKLRAMSTAWKETPVDS